MAQDAAWQVDDYRGPQGARPVRDVLAKLSEGARAKIAATLDMLAERGNALQFPMSRGMGGGLFEIRVAHPEGPFRILYVFRPGKRVILLHAFVKRTQETPKQDLDLAKDRKREVEKHDRK